jgi:hypothetical protein
MESTPERKLPNGNRHSAGNEEKRAANAHRYLVAQICCILTPDDEEYETMNLIELQKKSSAELRDIYNGLAERHVKRFADRVEAEKRTAVALQEAGQWEGDLPDNKSKAAAAKSKPAKTAPAKPGKAAKSAPAAKPAAKPAKAEKPAKEAKPKATKAPRQPVANRGAPRGNPTYKVLNPDAKMNAGSARTKVFNYVAEKGKGKTGIDRESIENFFVNDETVNVKSSLDYLVKVEILEVVKEG